jgi:1,4-dihydroxy-2-naphthoate octaprenyltransferase
MFAALSELVIATRPWSFTAGIIPVVITAAVAGVPLTDLKLISALVMAVSIQAGANLTNTYYDFANGVDFEGNGQQTLVDRRCLLVFCSLPQWSATSLAPLLCSPCLLPT